MNTLILKWKSLFLNRGIGKLKLKPNLTVAIALGIVGVIAIIVALILRFVPVGYLDFETLVLSDDEISRNLKAAELSSEDKSVKPSQLPVYAPLYERAGALYGGDEKIKLNSNFPVYSDDGAVIMALGEGSTLITEDFDRLTTYRNLYLSDGVSFNQDMERADSQNFILLTVSGGVYINLSAAEVGSKQIPMNSVMFLAEDHINFYRLQDRVFVYDRIDGLDENSTIKIGDRIYNYHDLLRNIGMLTDKTEPKPEEVPDEPEELDEGDNEDVPVVVPDKPDKKKPLPAPPQPNSQPLNISIHLSQAQCFLAYGKSTGYMISRLSVMDRSELVTSDVKVYLYQGDELIASYTLPKGEFAGKGSERVLRDIRVNQLVKGKEYTLYGTYKYKEDGKTKSVIFDWQTFIFDRPQQSNQPPIPIGYVRPEVTLEKYKSDVYFINGHQNVYDPAGRIRGGIQYEIFRLNVSASNVFMRKSIAGETDTHLGLLPPGEPFRIHAYYDYLNERGQTMRVDLGTVDISTLPFPADAKIKLDFAAGNIYSNKIQFKNVRIDRAASDSRLLEAATRIGVFAKRKNDSGDVGKDYYVGSQDTKSIRAGDPTEYNTTTTLKSRTTYTFEWFVFDPFGNKIPLLSPYTGEARTSSEAPYANILVSPKAGDTGFTIRIQNPDDVNISNANIAFYEVVNGVETLVSTQRVLPGGYGLSTSGYSIAPTGTDWTYNINIANFKLDRAYVIKITGDYDLEDGPNNTANMRTNQIIGSKQFLATTLKSLGNVSFNTTIVSTTGHEADILENVNRYATQQITLDLLSRVTFEIYKAADLTANPDSAVPVNSVTVNKLTQPAAFAELMDPNVRYQNLLTGLDSKCEYRIKIIPEILIADDYYTLPAVNDEDTFFTRKQVPRAVIVNGDLLAFSDAIYIFDGHIDDPDGAIIDGNISMLVTNGSSVPVYSATLAPNQNYDIPILGLDKGDTYTITFTATAYNDAYDESDYTSYRTNVRIETLPTGPGLDESLLSMHENSSSTYNDCYKVETGEGISGRLTLRGMDVIKDGGGTIIPGSLNTKLRVELNDPLRYLQSYPKYSLKFYRNAGYGEYRKVDDINYPYSWTENYLEDKTIPLTSKYYYRVELWITIGSRDVMIDQLFFDTQGPMTPIFTTNQLRWLSGQDARSGEDIGTKPLNAEWAPTVSDAVRNNKIPDGYGDGPVLTVADTGGRFGRYLVIEDLYHFFGNMTDQYGLLTEAGYNLTEINSLLTANGVAARTYITGVLDYRPNDQGTENADGAFNGVLDFQGHTLKYFVHTGSSAMPANNHRNVFWVIGYTGVWKNCLLEYRISGENPGETTNITPVYVNRGHIENIRIKSVGDNSRYNYAYSLLCYSNAVSGYIENFTVDLGEGVSTRAGFGGACYSNNGIIKDGYVYGSESGNPLGNDSIGQPRETNADALTRDASRKTSRHGRITVPIVPGSPNTTFSVTNIGGAVGSNTSTGRVSNVYSLADIYVNVFGASTTNRTYAPQAVGSVIGTSSGRANNLYSVGEPYYNTASVQTYKAGINPTNATNDYIYGPCLGGISGSARTKDSYYITADANRRYTGAWNTKTAVDTLHDYLWQQRITGKAFEALRTVSAGFYPQLIQTYGMPAQPYLPLPAVSAVENIELSSVFIEKQMEDYAIALVTLKNKSYYVITDFRVGALTANVVPGSQIDSDGVSRVQVRLDTPTEYKSTYNIDGFSYKMLNSTYKYDIDGLTMAVSAEFFKIVRTQQDWMDINNIKNWNYRLGNDLDLTGVAPAKAVIGTYGTGSTVANIATYFTGTIDGGYYDENYELQGMYTLSGVDLSSSTGSSVGLIPTLWGNGTISNLQIDGMKIDNQSATLPTANAALVVQTNAGARIDNVHMKNCSVKAYSYASIIVDALEYSDMTNCSVNNSRLRDNVRSIGGGTYMGGLVAVVTNGSTLYNSYVYGMDIEDNYSDQNRGVGALVGRFNSGEITNVYAQGKIKVQYDTNVGGLIGYRDSNDRILENCWTDVNITTLSRNAGGIIGGASTMTDFAEIDALALGDIDTALNYVPDATDRPIRRIVGTSGGNGTSVNIDGPVSGSFAYDGQLIATLPYDAWAGDIMGDDIHPNGPGKDGATMVSQAELLSEDYYLGTIHMDDGFVYNGEEFSDILPAYTGVAGGYLPLLRNTSGGLLPFQTVRKPVDHKYSVKVVSAQSNDATNWVVVMQVTHPAGAIIKEFEIENLEITNSSAYSITPQSSTLSSVVLTFNRSNIKKFVDTYAITGIKVDDPNNSGTTITEPAASRILFDALSVPYFRINSVSDWCEWMTADDGRHGQTTENIEITTDLDFTNMLNSNPALVYNSINVRVNRLRGFGGEKKIKNLNLTYPAISMGFVKNVNALVQDITFENVRTTQTVPGGARTGIIAECTGTVLRTNFTNIDLKTNGANQAGSIGYLSGIVDQVNLKNVHVDGTRIDTTALYKYNTAAYGSTGKIVSSQASTDGGNSNYIGGFVGYAVDCTITNVNLTYDLAAANAAGSFIPPIALGTDSKPLGEYDTTLQANPNIVWGRTYVGGIAGALVTSRISDCSVEYTSAYGEVFSTTNNVAGEQSAATSYVGGLIGYNTIYGAEPRNERLSVDHVRVISEGAATGGMFGHGLAYSTPEKPTTVDHTVVIAAGNNVGGFTGNWYSTCANVEVKNTKVFGRSNVGGFSGTGNSNVAYASSVLDCVVGSIFDDAAASSQPSFWTPQFKNVAGDPQIISEVGGLGRNLPDTLRMSRTFATYTAYNKYYGGYSGTGRGYSMTIANTLVGGEGADYVGGVVANLNDSSLNFSTVLDCKVYGRNYIGGLAGYMPKYSVGYCTSNAKVVGTGNYVGGIVGESKPDQALDGTNAAYQRDNIISGSVQGANYVGGLIGHVNGNLYPIKEDLVYYYANPHATAVAPQTGNNAHTTNNTSYTTNMMYISRDRDSIMTASVKMTTPGGHASLLYNLDDTIAAASRIQPMGNRIWEYSVLDIAGTATYAKDLMDGGKPLYKYASKDGEYLEATLAARNDGRGTGPNYKEEPLYSSENLLLTREHFLGTYSSVGINFAYSNSTASPPHIDANGLVDNWTLLNSYNKTDTATMNSSPYMRQVYRLNSGTGQNEPSYWWYGGYRAGYFPYTTAQIIYFYAANATTSPRSQAPNVEGRSGAAGSAYNPVAHSPFVNPVPAFGTWTPFTHQSRSPGSKYFSYALTTAHTYTGAWRDKNYSDLNVDQTYSGGVKIPTNPTGGAIFTLAVADEQQAPPTATVYAVSADKINVDFSGYENGGAFSLVDSVGREILGGPIEKSTYTFTYDFKTKLSVVTGSSGGTETYDIDPSELMRTVSVYKDDWYHIASGGVYAGSHADGAILEGSYKNLVGDEALNSDGDVYKVSTGTLLRHINEVGTSEEVQPLYEFDLNGTEIKTFANYSIAGGTVQPLRLYVKDGHLAALDPNLPVTYDGLLLDYKDNTENPTAPSEIMTVLGKDGVMADIKEPISLPKDFRTDFVREISNTLTSDTSVALVRYKSGRVAAFDYITGEEITLQADKGEGSLFAYAQMVLSDNASSMFTSLSGSYETLRDVEAAVRSGEYDAVDSVIGPADAVTIDESAQASESVESIPGVTLDKGTNEAEKVEAGKGDLARPEKAPELVSVYDITEGKYKVFEAESLLNESAVEPVAAVDLHEVDAAYMLEKMKAFGQNTTDKGIVILVVIAVLIVFLLGYVAIKRRKLTK